MTGASTHRILSQKTKINISLFAAGLFLLVIAITQAPIVSFRWTLFFALSVFIFRKVWLKKSLAKNEKEIRTLQRNIELLGRFPRKEDFQQSRRLTEELNTATIRQTSIQREQKEIADIPAYIGWTATLIVLLPTIGDAVSTIIKSMKHFIK